MSTAAVKHKYYLYILLPLIAIAVLYRVEKTTIFSYGYTMLLFFAFHVISKERKELDRNFVIFHYYLTHAIVLFCIFRYQIPEYLGMTGPEGGIGTDDCRFYAQVVGGKGVFYDIRVSLFEIHNFSAFLRLTYPFEVSSPLNLVTFNLLGVCFLPYYVKKLTYEILKDEKVANRAAILTLLCPFTTYFGCILMRDMLITTLVVSGMYFYLREKYIPPFLCFALIIWVRFGSVAYLMTGVLLLIRRNIIVSDKNSFKFSLLIIALVALFYYSFGYLQEFSGGKLGASIVRSSGDVSILEETTISRIQKWPFPINIIVLGIFFLVNPMFEWKAFKEGIYIMSSIYNNTFNAFYFLFLWPYIFNAIMSWLDNKKVNVELICLLMISFALLLGIIDLQIRHKCTLIPFMCMVAAYGMVRFDKKSKYTTFVFGATMATIQIAFFIKGFM